MPEMNSGAGHTGGGPPGNAVSRRSRRVTGRADRQHTAPSARSSLEPTKNPETASNYDHDASGGADHFGDSPVA